MDLKKKLSMEQAGIDLGLVARTQPQGNVVMHNTYMQMGDGVMCCLRVWSIPSSDLNYHWLAELEFPNSITNVMVGTFDKQKFMKMLEKSMDEHGTRVKDTEKDRNNLDSINARKQQLQLMNDIDQHGEIVKRLYVRVFLYAHDYAELMRRKREIMGEMDKYKSQVFVEEVDVDWKDRLLPATKQNDGGKIRRPWHGIAIDSRSLGASYPFNHVDLDDPFGGYMGWSTTKGQIMFDPTRKTDTRTSPFMITLGRTRYGKSSQAKTLLEYMYKRGGYILNFDVANEYSALTKYLYGLELTLDGSKNRINIFEVWPTITKSDGSIDEMGSWAQHVQKFRALTSELNQKIDDDDLDLLEQELKKFYNNAGLLPLQPEAHPEEIRLIGLPHDQYPTLDFFVQFLMQQEHEIRSDEKKKVDIRSIHRITRIFSKLLDNNRSIFNGYTNIPDFSDIHCVTFQLAGVKDQPAIMHALILNCLSLISSQVVHRGEKWRKLFDAGKIAYEQIPYTWINWDEFQRSATMDFIEGIKWVSSYMQEMPKNFAGIHLIMPQLKSADPEELKNSSSEKFAHFRLEMSKIMGLMQYRVFFNLVESDIPRVKNLLGESITDDELSEIPKLKRFWAILNIAGESGNIQYKIDPSKAQLRRFTGGA